MLFTSQEIPTIIVNFERYASQLVKISKTSNTLYEFAQDTSQQEYEELRKNVSLLLLYLI